MSIPLFDRRGCPEPGLTDQPSIKANSADRTAIFGSSGSAGDVSPVASSIKLVEQMARELATLPLGHDDVPLVDRFELGLQTVFGGIERRFLTGHVEGPRASQEEALGR